MISIVTELCEVHPAGEVAVMVMVAVFTVPVLFVPDAAILFPDPDDGETDVLPGKLAVQVKVVPGILLPKEIGETEAPEQID